MNAHREEEVQLKTFLTLALHRDERFAAYTNQSTPMESALNTHSM
jgi:hypothetical protein